MSESRVRTDLALSARDLSKRFRLEKVGQRAPHFGILRPLARLVGGLRRDRPRAREFWALDGVTFDIKRGERVAVIGRNGAGKTTLLKVLSRVVSPTRGEARICGRLTSLLEVGTGFNNSLTGRENVYVNASMHGVGRRETAERFQDIVEFSGLDPRFIDMRVKHYSSGMRLRLAFSVAAHLDADIMLLDEVLAVGDMAFQEKCLERVEGMMKQKRTVLFVSHDMASATRFCERALWLEQGRVVMDGPVQEVVAAYTEAMRKNAAGHRWIRETGNGRQPAATTEVPSGDIREPTSRSLLGGGLEDREVLLRADGTLEEPPSAEMVAVGVIDREGREIKAATVDKSIGIEFVYDVLREGKIVLPDAKFFTDDGIQMFSAVYTDPEYMRHPKSRGRYRSVLWLPPHLFNVGVIHVTVKLTTPHSGDLERHAVIDRALSFEMFEAPLGAPSARGMFMTLRGVVRPLCDWETRKT